MTVDWTVLKTNTAAESARDRQQWRELVSCVAEHSSKHGT